MDILLLGSGGREDALAWRLRQSPSCGRLFAAPGNPGIARWAECVAADPCDPAAVVELAKTNGIDLVVIGPEAPLVAGVGDALRAEGIAVFGPSAAAAQLEGSKGFTKDLCRENAIPTADYVRAESAVDARAALDRFGLPVVIKADGLAAGKGVVIAKTREEASNVANEMISGRLLGEAGKRVVLEEHLQGEEVSFLALCDGERAIPLVAAQDHKRIGDGDTGPNTGGMGAYSSPSVVDANMSEWLLTHVTRPVIQAMKSEGAEYRGVLYCGLMMTAKGPMVLEFNCRFGDPETQPILMRLESDLLGAFIASAEGRLSEGDLKWSKDSTVCVVMASKGYPDNPELGKTIHGLPEADEVTGVKVFHAGTRKTGDQYVTNAGRVLGVTARAADLKSAVDRAYEAVAKIKFEGMQFRRDIAARGLRGK